MNLLQKYYFNFVKNIDLTDEEIIERSEIIQRVCSNNKVINNIIFNKCCCYKF